MPVDLESLPLRLFIASQERHWLPSQLDYSREREDWARLDEGERDLLLRLTAGFLVGERGVTHELAPLQQALRRQRGHMEEEMYLTAQLYEEAKHVEFFQRWLNETLPGVFGRDIPYPDLRGDLFSERLPSVMQALWRDDSPEAQVRAIVTYHMYVEGVGAESSYPIYFDILERGILPALREGLLLVRRDEARHIAFGTYLLQKMLARQPRLRETFELEMEAMRPYLDDGLLQTFAGFAEGEVPFGLDPGKYHRLIRANFDAQLRAIDERVLA